MKRVEFFERLADGYQPLLAYAEGTLQTVLDIDNHVEYWCLSIKRGDVIVSREQGAADSTVHVKEQLFEQLVSGAKNATAAFLRGDIGIEGTPSLLLALQRLFPGPRREPQSA
jgi:predicted lipid carrier protein YhbT